jgi:8-oxo-dGTP diphosphatase
MTKRVALGVCLGGDRVLLVSKDGSRWTLPGGRPREDESFADAAGRELEEETALSAKGVGLLFQVFEPTTLHHVFLANIGKTAVPKPGKEIASCQWFSLLEINAIVVARQIMNSFFCGNRR